MAISAKVTSHMSRRCIFFLSAPQMSGFMIGQPERLESMGFKSAVVSAPSVSLDEFALRSRMVRYRLKISRDVSPLQDLKTIWGFCYVLQKERPDIIFLSGPKALFLGSIAVQLMGIGRAIPIYHGMRQENLSGIIRSVLDWCDRLTFHLADKVLVVSPSLRKLIIQNKLSEPSRLMVLGNGTANGIDANWFNRTEAVLSSAENLRINLGLPCKCIVGFVGRINEDKGIGDLIRAFELIERKLPDAVLLVVGTDEIKSRELKERVEHLYSKKNVRLVGSVQDVRPYLALMDVFLFPSSREGFPIAPMEASAMGVPVVGYSSTGTVDAIVHGVTGMLCPVGEFEAMAESAILYLQDFQLRKTHGSNARNRICEKFTPENVWQTYSTAIFEEV